MAQSFKALSVVQLVRHIRSVSRDSSRVFITQHAGVRMRQRRVLDAEVFECLRKGAINQPPEEDLKTGNLVCRMERYGASRNLCVCVALDDGASESVIVVTVIVLN